MRNKHKNILVSIAAGLPTIGGPLSVLLDKYVPIEVEERRDFILKELGIFYAGLSEDHLENLFNNKNFISLFIKCMRAAVEESANEKSECFKNIIINISNEGSTFDYDELSLFISIILRLTNDQIKMLVSILNDETIYTSSETGLYQAFIKKYPELDEGYVQYCIADIQRDLLCGSMDKYKKLAENEGRRFIVTPLGKRLLSYIMREKNMKACQPKNEVI